MLGRTTKIKEFISQMRELDMEVIPLYTITENMMKRIFNKNKNKIEEILIVLKQGEKFRNSDNSQETNSGKGLPKLNSTEKSPDANTMERK